MKKSGFVELTLAGERLLLSSGKAMIWPAQELVVIADLHLGKSALFRQHGIPVPASVQQNDLDNISNLLAQFPSKKLVVVGDMFHQDFNDDIHAFTQWRNAVDALEIILVQGNHDRLAAAHYQNMGIEVKRPHFDIGPFRFVHEPPKKTSVEFITISGHLHPGVRLRGKAKQGMRLPCFRITSSTMVLPAFSVFTGLQFCDAAPDCAYFAIAGNEVLKI